MRAGPGYRAVEQGARGPMSSAGPAPWRTRAGAARRPARTQAAAPRATSAARTGRGALRPDPGSLRKEGPRRSARLDARAAAKSLEHTDGLEDRRPYSAGAGAAARDGAAGRSASAMAGRSRRRRSAFVSTKTEESAIAPAARIGERSTPATG